MTTKSETEPQRQHYPPLLFQIVDALQARRQLLNPSPREIIPEQGVNYELKRVSNQGLRCTVTPLLDQKE
ncbi:MAG: hypothetical protein QF586_05450 [Arenicellales bacterium]|jgi:hypothetical protein|nr:hypothetical protein [Arenicellales bacterium]MDP6434580.1 hypothetical protein [Arenicellales bacterium]MDP6672735.1 hypothetical protein [Arenicellales bacterium]MDP6724251.1 hypothetical protein [Arenicellales bacterium]MDP7156247.1 hypothetical protein [Arenicellales bacterium]